MLKVKKLKKKFIRMNSKKQKEEFYADYDISFSAKEGEIVGILGPNGAGKTTLLRMIAGILEPTEGTVDFDGLNYKENEIEIKKRIAYLSGNTKIYNTLSTYELLNMCCDFYDVPMKEREARIREISKTLRMDSFLLDKLKKSILQDVWSIILNIIFWMKQRVA